MSEVDIESVIEDTITDAELPADPIADDPSPTADDPAVEAAPADDAPAEPDTPTDQVDSPAVAEAKTPEQTEFEKKFGITAQSSSGRENRIPYSRVQKIVAKNEKDITTKLTKEYEAKYQPFVQQASARIQDYETRLKKVAEFEQVMQNDAPRFVQMLATLPQYKELFTQMMGSQATPGKPTTPITDDMPQPDQQLPDGSAVYTMEGLKALNAWNRDQARKETLSEVEKRFGPIEQEWQTARQMKALEPKIQAQIDEARTWPQFKDHEDEITKALQADGRLSLEGAYRQVVYPKLAADRNKMREEIMKEIKSAPRATSAPSSTSRPSPASTSTGPRSLEDVITESIKVLK